jgi:vitamin B12 transporter
MRLIHCAALAAAFLLCPRAYAETDDIVVTATRTPTPRERLPARVERIDRDAMESAAMVTLPDALGADAVQAGGAGQQASLFLRGANSSHALALLDGVRLNDASTPNGQYDFGLDTLGGLERIEIVRGPASAIYGSDALGGAVNMIPRRGGDSAGFGELALGSFDAVRALAGASGESGDLAYGLSAEHFRSEGHDLIPARMQTHTGDRDGAELSSATLSLRRDSGRFGFDALARARQTESAFDTFSGGVAFNLRADDPDLENRTQQYVWRMGADVQTTPAITMRLSGGQVQSDRVERDNGAETSAAQSARSFIDALAAYRRDALTLNAGLSFEQNAIDTRPPFAAPLSVNEDLGAAFLIGQFDWSENIALTGALRRDFYENFGAVTTYSAGAVAQFGALRVFASHGTAFKAPSLSERFETSAFSIANPDLDPEHSRSVELGADWALQATTKLGASLYSTRIRNLIQYDFARPGNINIGRAAIDGAEVFLEAAPVSWASLRLGYVWTDARNQISGARLARRPRHAWRLEATLTPTERIALNASWVFVGDRRDVTYNDAGAFASGSGLAPGYNLASAAATYQVSGSTSVFARISNLSDAAYEQPAAFASAPRDVQLGIRARF